MNAPNLWQSFLIVIFAFAAFPYFIALLKKLRLLPLAVYWLAVNLFPEWAGAHPLLCMVLLVLFAAYPILTVVVKIIQWHQEEVWVRNHLLATAHHMNDPSSLTEQ